MNITVLMLCAGHVLASLVDELSDWRGEGAIVLLHGPTEKAVRGFIFVGWSRPVPERFHHKLHADPDVIDYFVFGNAPAGNTSV